MRTSTLLTAAFAGVALSSPLVKRDTVLEVDTVVDVVYVTQVVTETAGATAAAVTSTVVPVTSTVESSSSTEEAASTTPVVKSFYQNRFSWTSAWTSTYAVAASSSDVPVVESSSSTSVSVATSTEIAATSSTAEVSLITSITNVASGAIKTSSSPSSPSSTLLTTSLVLEARAAVPTCNVNNVAIVTKAKPNYSAFCSNWRAAGTAHSAPVTVTGVTNAQITNICSCLLAATYVHNTPVSTTNKVVKVGLSFVYPLLCRFFSLPPDLHDRKWMAPLTQNFNN